MDISELIISPDSSVKDALRQLDKSGLRILFVAEGGRLLGTLTDGDIRRHILRDGDILKPVVGCYNPNPVSLREGYEPEEARALMLGRKVDVLPVVSASGELVDYVRWQDIFGEKPRSRQVLDVPVVIMAGGKGTRLDPFTKILPKPLIPVGDKPIVEHIMDRFHEQGASDFYITVNYKGEMIKSYFENTDVPYRVHYVWEEEFMGTAGSLRFLPSEFSGTFILSNCDVVIEADYASLLSFHRKGGYPLTMVGSMQHYRIPYGVMKIDEDGALRCITEKPEYDLMVNTGLYVLEHDIVGLIPEGKAFHMTDLVEALMKQGRKVGVFPVSEKSYVDIGQWEEYRKNMERFLTD